MKPDHVLKPLIRQLILDIYPGLPDQFYAHALYQKVVNQVILKTGHKPYADTIMRYFRQLRDQSLIKCDCVNRKESMYQKR